MQRRDLMTVEQVKDPIKSLGLHGPIILCCKIGSSIESNHTQSREQLVSNSAQHLCVRHSFKHSVDLHKKSMIVIKSTL